MILRLKRFAKRDGYTIGRLYAEDRYICDTVEDTDRGLYSILPLKEIERLKVYGQTAIPTGCYKIVPHYSPKFKDRVYGQKYGGYFPMLEGVKGFEGVLIHPGNSADDSLGCIIPGENKVKGGVINSRNTYYRLMDDFIRPSWASGKPVYIRIE